MLFCTKAVPLLLFCSATEVLASKYLKFDFVKRSLDVAGFGKRQLLNDTSAQDVAKLVRIPIIEIGSRHF